MSLFAPLQEGVAAGIFHESLAAEFAQLADKHKLHEINQILNTQDYPDADRDEDSICKNCKALLKLACSLDRFFDRLGDVLGRAAGLVVGGHWAMTLALTLQPSPKTPVPDTAREAKKALLDEPGSGRRIVDFWTGALMDRLQTARSRAEPKASASAGPAPQLILK